MLQFYPRIIKSTTTLKAIQIIIKVVMIREEIFYY